VRQPTIGEIYVQAHSATTLAEPFHRGAIRECLGSSAVHPAFKKIAEADRSGTHPAMTRNFMTNPDASMSSCSVAGQGAAAISSCWNGHPQDFSISRGNARVTD